MKKLLPLLPLVFLAIGAHAQPFLFYSSQITADFGSGQIQALANRHMIDPYPEVTYLTASAQVTLAGFGGSVARTTARSRLGGVLRAGLCLGIAIHGV